MMTTTTTTMEKEEEKAKLPDRYHRLQRKM